LGGESKAKEPRGVHAHIPHEILKRKASKPPQEICQQKAPKITKKEKQERHNVSLRNHAESSMHTMKVHTRSSLPIDHTSLSRSHHEALKVVLEIPK
jgi:secreted PhoX family phosphatase